MRKVTVRRRPTCTMWGVGGTSYTQREIEEIFGAIPPEGESRDYYIVPAGQVAEFEMSLNENDPNDEHRFVFIKGEGWSDVLEFSDETILHTRLNRGETRRVTAIIHDPEPNPEPPLRLRRGWFSLDGQTVRVMELESGQLMVTNGFFVSEHKSPFCTPESVKDKGIEINWYED